MNANNILNVKCFWCDRIITKQTIDDLRCEYCANEVEFRARTIADEPKITEVGQPCRKCTEPVILRKAGKKSHTYKAYYYCPNCKTIYFSPKFLMTEEDVLKDTLL